MAENCNNYCTDPIDEQVLNDCSEELQGGISAAILLECNHQLTSPSNATQINAEIAAGRAHLLLNIKMGLPAPSPITVDSNVGGGLPTVVNYDRTASLVDGNVNDNNVQLYDKLFYGYKLGGLILYEVGTEESLSGTQVTWIDRTVKATGGRLIPDNTGEFQRFEGTFTWRSRNNGNIYAAPVGIFS